MIDLIIFNWLTRHLFEHAGLLDTIEVLVEAWPAVLVGSLPAWPFIFLYLSNPCQFAGEC